MDGTRGAAKPRVASRPRALARIVATAGLGLVFGCSGAATTSPDAAAVDTSLSAPATLRLAATVDTIRTSGSIPLPRVEVLDGEGRPLQRDVAWSIGAQAPWLAERPVIEGSGSPSAPFEVVGFGRAELVAALPDGTLRATYTVVVEGGGPTVVEVAPVAGQEAAFELLGWDVGRLDRADVFVDGRPVDALAVVDSARVRATYTSAPVAGCAGTERVEVRAGDTLHTLHRPRPGTLDLAPGESLRLPRSASHCLSFPSEPGARYYAGFVDVAALEVYGDEALAWEADDWDRVGGEAPLEVRVASRPSRAHNAPSAVSAAVTAGFTTNLGHPASAGLTPERSPTASDAFFETRGSGTPPGHRAEAAGPLAVVAAPDLAIGDTLRVRARHCPTVTPVCATSRPAHIEARIERVVDGWLAIAVPAGQDIEGWREEVLEPRLESLAALGPDAGSGHLERLFDVPRPTTAGVGQLVWITGPEVVGAFASGATTGCSIQAPDAAPLATVVHELAHCFQFAADREGRATRWALESGADVAAWAVLRARAGQGWSTEVPHAAVGGGAAEGAIYGLPFAVASSGGSGTVARWADGYGASALLMDDWIARLTTEGGVHPDAAAREVLLGALEQGRGAGSGGGLIPRLAAVWPGAFDIAGAMLETLARQALDVEGGRSVGAGLPWIELDAGLVPPLSRPAVEFDAATHASVALALPHSTWGFVRFDDDDLGGSLELVDDGRLDWVVVRVR